jgi:mRNA-degrading endonuclease toxin of MazEF toxin-antitoxin module
MLPDKELDKLCHGRIIYASFYNSFGTDDAGPHNAVILDSDENVQEHDSYFVAIISSNEAIDAEFNFPVPAYTGIKGFVKCRWIEQAHRRAITRVRSKIHALEMERIAAMVRAARISKNRNK